MKQNHHCPIHLNCTYLLCEFHRRHRRHRQTVYLHLDNTRMQSDRNYIDTVMTTATVLLLLIVLNITYSICVNIERGYNSLCSVAFTTMRKPMFEVKFKFRRVDELKLFASRAQCRGLSETFSSKTACFFF